MSFARWTLADIAFSLALAFLSAAVQAHEEVKVRSFCPRAVRFPMLTQHLRFLSSRSAITDSVSRLPQLLTVDTL